MLTSLADELGRVTLEIRISQRLGEQIRRHVLGADEGDRHDAGLLHLARVVVRQLYVLGHRALHGVGCRT